MYPNKRRAGGKESFSFTLSDHLKADTKKTRRLALLLVEKMAIISEASVATCLKRAGSSNDDFIANLLLSMEVKTSAHLVKL